MALDAPSPLFPTRSPGYSSFFISGLLSPPSSSPSESLHSRDSSFEPGPRRGSLPTDSSAPSYTSSTDDASMFYFTLQPRRDKDEYRSFLSLDLAESQSMRSRSTRRRPSSRPRHHHQSQSSEPPFTVDFQIPDSPCLLPPPSPVARNSPAPTARSVPSPKPAPVSSLPHVPPSPHGATLQVVASRTRTPTPIELLPVPPRRKPSVASHATRASATTSTVSTRYRVRRRDKALACLEGRRPAPRPDPTENFMSLSEDEEEEEEAKELSVRVHTPEDDVDLSLTDDQLIMLIARLDDGDIDSAPASSPPLSKVSSRSSSKHSSPKPRRGKTGLGLKSFMDFHNDEDSNSRWSWRSFIEVAT